MINKKKEKFACPVCNYHGPFVDIEPETGLRKNAKCPKCGSLERHRLQYLVIKELFQSYNFSKMSMLHFAPEAFFHKHFKKMFKDYTTVDLVMKHVELRADMRDLPFRDAQYHFVFASHVLEHIKEDYEAISEIRRIIKPGGIAVLPVPIVAYETVEYPAPNPHECGHVRAPGLDYYERYLKYFSKVDICQSGDFPDIHQSYHYEDRSNWPTDIMPLRPTMAGDKHPDFVPVCIV